MRIPIIIAFSLLLAQAQAPKGVIEGRVVRASTREPISDVLITLNVPGPANPAANLSADAAARLTAQINALSDDGARSGQSQDAINSAIENARRNAGAGPSRPLTMMTDASGHFSFRDLAPGRYTIRAERDGYFAVPVNGTASTALTKTITVPDGNPSPPVDLLMVKGAVISGRVRDPNGQPISGMNVSVYRVTYNLGRKSWTVSNSKVTDDRGEYRIYWIFPGEYYVGVTPRVPGPTPGPQDSWARTFFPGATDPSGATPIEIKDGDEEAAGTDINIRAAAAAAFKISGVAINSAARPNPTTGVVDRAVSTFYLSPRDPGVLDALVTPTVVNALPIASRQNGEFELRNIRPGSYDLYPVGPLVVDPASSTSVSVSSAQAAAPLPPLSSVVSIQATGGTVLTTAVTGPAGTPVTRRQPTSRNPIDVRADITDLRLVLSPGVLLSGEVLVNGAESPLKRDSIRLTLRSLDSLPATFTAIIGAIPVDPSGKFTASGIPEARYTFQISGLPATAYVADIRQGGASVFDTGFVMDQSGNPVQVVVDTNGGTVQGFVQNAEGKPAANATVALVPPASRRQNTLLYRNIATNEDGSFTLKGVPPGQYTVFAWESVLPTAWMNAEFLSRYEGRGRPVAVTASAPVEVQINLIPMDDRR